jgi:hypothetical protein
MFSSSCRMQGSDEKLIQNMGWNSEAKRPFGRPRFRGEDNIRVGHREFGWEGVDWKSSRSG